MPENLPPTDSLHWRDWTPPLSASGLTLGEVMRSLPGHAAEEIPAFIRAVENPASPIALPGAVTLPRHDAIHILLGRGMLLQDEAFVIGVTMGTARDLRPRHAGIFRFLSSRFYPAPYRFAPRHFIAYDLGLKFGMSLPQRDLHDVPFETMEERELDQLRRSLGIDVNTLCAYFQTERLLLPDTAESRRLPVRPQSGRFFLYRPHGPRSDWRKSAPKAPFQRLKFQGVSGNWKPKLHR